MHLVREVFASISKWIKDRMCDFDSAAQVSQPGTGTDLHEQQPDTVRSGDEHIQKMPGCLIKFPMQISHVGVWNSSKNGC